MADKVGVNVRVLEQRPTSQDRVLTALRRRLYEGLGDDPILAGLSAKELLRSISSLTEEGRLEQALVLAQRAHEIVPTNEYITNSVAICLIPSDPHAARILLNRTQPRGGVELSVKQANLATIGFLLGDKELAAAEVRSLGDQCGDQKAWLWHWSPTGPLRSAYTAITAWAEAFLLWESQGYGADGRSP